MERIGIGVVAIGETKRCPTVGRQGIELSQRALLHDSYATIYGKAVTQRVGELTAQQAHDAIKSL